MNIEEYLEQYIKQHLSDASTYDRISKEVSYECMIKNVEEFLEKIKQLGL